MNNKKGFTLVEIIIVVGILGILTAIAFSNIQGYRDKAQKYICIGNLRELDNNISLWAINNGKADNAAVTMGDLVPAYFKSTPYCPLDSAKSGYILTTVSRPPQCPANPQTHKID